MTGAEISLLVSALAGPLMGGLFGGNSDQPRQSFEGQGAIDPRNMMRHNAELVNRIGAALTQRLGQPVNLRSAVVQQPGAYSGGGLPFPIGVTAQDPALSDPSLLSLAGIPGLSSIFSGGAGAFSDPGGFPEVGYSTPPGAGANPFDKPQGEDFFGYDTNTGAFDNFYQTPFDQRTPQNRQGTTDGLEPTPHNAAEARGPRRRSEINDGEYGQLVRADDLMDGNAPGDDLSRAMGSVQLLLEAFR